MKIFLDCLPCLLKQALEASRMATDNNEIQEQIMIESINILSNYKQYSCSPELAFETHNVVKRLSKNRDPYFEIKQRDIEAAKNVYPALKLFLKEKNNELYWALKIAATGNIIDSAISNNIDIKGSVEKEIEKAFGICDIKDFEQKLKETKMILIIGDNSGETVFDKVLIEHLAHFNVTYSVRNSPIINDATMEEAIKSGLAECTTLISTGCNAPGAVLEKCSDEFIDVFNKADIVISKGQGNYEALSDCDRKVYFLLKAKCPMVARKLGVNLNDYVLKMSK